MNENETNQSEIARIKQQIAVEYQAASRIFTDFTAIARHAYLTARQEKLGACLEALTQHMSPEDAMQTFIQAQAETGEVPSDKAPAEEPETDPANSYGEIGGLSSGTTS
jgi:hypothetical protein